MFCLKSRPTPNVIPVATNSTASPTAFSTTFSATFSAAPSTTSWTTSAAPSTISPTASSTSSASHITQSPGSGPSSNSPSPSIAGAAPQGEAKNSLAGLPMPALVAIICLAIGALICGAVLGVGCRRRRRRRHLRSETMRLATPIKISQTPSTVSSAAFVHIPDLSETSPSSMLDRGTYTTTSSHAVSSASRRTSGLVSSTDPSPAQTYSLSSSGTHQDSEKIRRLPIPPLPPLPPTPPSYPSVTSRRTRSRRTRSTRTQTSISTSTGRQTPLPQYRASSVPPYEHSILEGASAGDWSTVENSNLDQGVGNM